MRNSTMSLMMFPAAFETAMAEPAGSVANATPAGDAGAQPGGGVAAPSETSSTPQTETPATPAEQTFEIKVDGKVEKVTREDLIALGQQGRDYTRKTQQLADERRRWESDRQSILEQERQRWQNEQRQLQERQRQDQLKDPAARALDETRQLREKMEDQALDFAVKNVLTAHKDLVEDDLLREAMKRGITSADDFAKNAESIAQDLEKSATSKFDSRFSDLVTKGEHPALKSFRERVIADYLKEKGGKPAPAGALPGAVPALGGSKKQIKTLDDAADETIAILAGADRA